MNKALKIMGYEQLQTGHGFRGLASTIMNERSGFRPDAIERQLAHDLGLAWRSLERRATKKPQSIDLWGFSWHSVVLCACILVGSTGFEPATSTMST